jgi:Na+/phosphate symporter
MSDGTDFTAEIYLRRIVVNNQSQLDIKIKETEEEISRIREHILMYAASSPKDIVSEDWQEESISFIHFKVSDFLNELSESVRLLADLNYYKESNPFKTEK